MSCPKCGCRKYNLLQKATNLSGEEWQPKRCKKCSYIWDEKPHKMMINPFGI